MTRQKIKDNLKDILQVKNLTAKSADLYFYGDIVSSWWGAWDDTDQYPESVKNFLNDVKGKDLNIHINSGGGSVFAGITIYNMLKNHDGFKTVYIDGVAASIASVIALSGDKIIMGTGSSFMIHKPLLNYVGGNADDLRQMAEFLDKIQECIMQVYEENVREDVDIKIIEDMVNEETWLTNEEAVEYFNVEIDESFEAVACTSELFNYYKNVPVKIKNSSKKSIVIGNKTPVKNKLNISKDGEDVMTIEELKNKYPDLYNEIFNEGKAEGANVERARIKEIEDLAVPGNEDIINKAKFEETLTAAETAVKIIKAQKQKGVKFLENREEDIKNSNITKVNAGKDEFVDKEVKEKEEEDSLLDKAASIINKKRGVK